MLSKEKFHTAKQAKNTWCVALSVIKTFLFTPGHFTVAEKDVNIVGQCCTHLALKEEGIIKNEKR